MLIRLSIRDIVLIERLDIEFGSGLAVLTGETGAGKSILLDAFALALGARGDATLVRHGAEQGQVTAAFELDPGHPAREILAELRRAGIRAIADLRNEKINYKIREHSLQKLPYQVILGDKELQANQVAVRTRAGEDLGAMSRDAFINRLQSETASRR